jgi:predicted P-loop ATPase
VKIIKRVALKDEDLCSIMLQKVDTTLLTLAHKSNKYELDLKNVKYVISFLPLRFDEFTATKMIGDGVNWVPFDDNTTIKVCYALAEFGFKGYNYDLVRKAICDAAFINTYDSAIEWANSLKWDGVKRVEKMMHTHFGADDSGYTRACGLYIASAMAGRLLQPGCKADMAIILVGEQGSGKTTSVEALAPIPESFIEINLTSRDQDLSRQLRGKLIGELGELRGLRSRQSEDIKAWMTRTHEEWIPKYGEYSIKFPRRLVFFGTTNEDRFLNDTTGNRRFLPVKVGKANVDLIKKDRDQIWAEAVHLFKDKGVLWEDAKTMAEEVNKGFMVEDEFIINGITEFIKTYPDKEKFTSSELWKFFSIKEPGIGEFRRLAGSVKTNFPELEQCSIGSSKLKGYRFKQKERIDPLLERIKK